MSNFLPKKNTWNRLFNWCCTFVFMLFSVTGCHTGKKETGQKLFDLLDPAETHIDFTNQLSYDIDFNIFTYRNFYNGGGVAIGDINNDGLPDVFFGGQYGTQQTVFKQRQLSV